MVVGTGARVSRLVMLNTNTKSQALDFKNQS